MRRAVATATVLLAVLAASATASAAVVPDRGFGSGGVATTSFDKSDAQIRDLAFGTGFPECAAADGVAIDPEGRIVVAGNYRRLGGLGLAIARLLPDGTLDPSFGTGGVLSTPVAACCAGLAVQSDGKIVLGLGNTETPELGRQQPAGLSVVRLNADGSPDAGFGGGDGVAEGPALRLR